MMNNRTIAVINILFGNRSGAGFEINHRQYCLRTKKKLFPFLHEKSNTLKYLENIQANLLTLRIYSLDKTK